MTHVPGKIVYRDDVSPVPWLGEKGRFLLRGEDTGGAFSFFEVTTSPGGGPPLHLHEDHDEALFVVEGRYEVRVENAVVTAEPGTLAFSPRGSAHRFVNVLDVPSRLLIVASPGGHERFFEDLSAMIAAGPPSPEKFQEVAARHHVVGLEPMRFPPGLGPRPPVPAGTGGLTGVSEPGGFGPS